jgi:thiol-disulfide isomerase/thioredoxin
MLMVKILRKILIIIGLIICGFHFGYAQKEAIIMGKIDNPTSLNISVEYKLNPFTLEDALYEGSIDLNNLFGIKIKLNEPRTVIFYYQNQKIPIFIVPGDTLKMMFEGNKILETVSYEGDNAVSNKYLAAYSKKFPDSFDDKGFDYYRFKDKPFEFRNFIDTTSISRKAFEDNYAEKAIFTNTFKDFIQNNRIYWRFFHLLNYVQFFNLKTFTDFKKDETAYFAFLKEAKVSNEKALNSVFYLRFLNQYLAYQYGENSPIGAMPPDAIQEKLSIVQVVKPRRNNLPVWDNPLNSPNQLTKLVLNEEVLSQYLTTNEPVSFMLDDVKYIDYFLKVKLRDGRIGWVPQSFITNADKEIVEHFVSPRLCFNSSDTLCGFQRFLEGKTLYFATLRELVLSTATISMASMQQRSEAFLSKNVTFRPYNDALRSVFKSVEADRENRIERLIVPADCSVEYFNLNKLFFDKNLSAQFGNQVKEEARTSLVPSPTASSENPNGLTYKPGKPNVFKGLVINDNLPPFKIKDIAGNEIRQQDLLGKVVYIDFWATWCSPCQAEISHSQSLIERYKENKNIVFIYISMDTDIELWKQYIKDNKLQGIHTNDAENIPQNLKIEGLPNYLIIDKNGRVAYNSRIPSKIDADSMIEFLLR